MASFSRSWNDDEDDDDDDVPFSWRNVRLARIRAAQLSPSLRASRPRLGAGMATRLVTTHFRDVHVGKIASNLGINVCSGRGKVVDPFARWRKLDRLMLPIFLAIFFGLNRRKGRKRKEEILCIFWKFSGSIVGSITIFLHVLRRGLYSNSCVEFNSNRII